MRALECFLLTPSSVSLGSLDILVLAVSQSLEFLGVLTRAIIPHPWILPGAHKRSLQVIHSPLELLSQDHPPPPKPKSSGMYRLDIQVVMTAAMVTVPGPINTEPGNSDPGFPFLFLLSSPNCLHSDFAQVL